MQQRRNPRIKHDNREIGCSYSTCNGSFFYTVEYVARVIKRDEAPDVRM